MGQARNRGSFEERKAQAIEASEKRRVAREKAEYQAKMERVQYLASLTPEKREEILRAERKKNQNWAAVGALLAGLPRPR
jgi:hypothetical protein